MVIGGSQLITGWYSEVTMLPLEGAAVAHKDTFFTMDRLIYYYICALIDNRILNPPSPLYSWNIFALHRLLVNFFADLTIDNPKSTQLVYNSGKNCLELLVLSIAPGPGGLKPCRRRRNQYWPRAILIARRMTCLHPPRRTHQELYSVPRIADKQSFTTVVNQLCRLSIINCKISKKVYK